MAFVLSSAETAIHGFSLLAGSRAVQPGDLQGPLLTVSHLWDCSRTLVGYVQLPRGFHFMSEPSSCQSETSTIPGALCTVLRIGQLLLLS